MVKKILPWVVFVLLFVLLIVGFSIKDSMNNYLSGLMQKQASHEIIQSGSLLVDSLYNYSTNGLQYEVTFLEFGATNCSACKRMESVMEEISSKYQKRVNVVFMNIMKPENQNLMKYYGIATIPTQVLLDKNGEEFFRHSGFISATKLESQFQKY